MDLKRAQTMAVDLMQHYNLLNWKFNFDRSVTRLGLCQHYRRIISLGSYATSVNGEEQVLNTILHEIAHALVGSTHGHDSVWYSKATELGCNGKRCGNIAVKAPSKYRIFCGGCNGTWNIYRLSKRYLTHLEVMWCKSCGRERSKGKLVLETVK